ncbi:hypothetical protein Tsubulata_011122 [Turnera subulata]|uniref:Uncharacterized protein n=1 Tax=Turnera subulata TaxID=218843 RepID=A0A9Q0J770_9ROSI|nr:hypothetical protein Tsubulata_011122 [Turnera subulata]
MLCSIPTGKSSSNWLDRLRSSKGFPAAQDDHPDLDSFLTHIPDPGPIPGPGPSGSPTTIASSNIESTQSSTGRRVAAATGISSEKQWFGIMTNVLADLFNMGGAEEEEEGPVDDRKLSRKRKQSSRKQARPRFCCVVDGPGGGGDVEEEEEEEGKNSSDCVRKDENVLEADATASLHSDKYSNNGNGSDEDVEEGNGDGGGDREELKGYSRSEVTVIDTSFEVWKCDKMVFRKKNVWKVRDKKGKSWAFGSKKRKGNDLGSGNGNAAGAVLKKKAKVLNLECGSSKDAADEDQEAQNEKRSEVSKIAPDELSEVPRKRQVIDLEMLFCLCWNIFRFRCARIPRKPENNGSSIIVKKAEATSKKRGTNLPKNQFKDTQKQHKA